MLPVVLLIVMGIGYYHWHWTSGFFQICRVLAIVFCVPLPSAFVNGTYTYVYRNHVATEDTGLGLYVLGSSSQAAGAGSSRRLHLHLVLIVLYGVLCNGATAMVLQVLPASRYHPTTMGHFYVK
jgi:hypothetical protein